MACLRDRYYRAFQQAADDVKNDFVAFLIEQRRAGLPHRGLWRSCKEIR